MSNIPKYLNDMWETPEADRKAPVDLLLKILSNVISNPEDPKFRDINFTKIRKKFKGCPSAFHYLFSAGFSQSIDGSRLQFQQQNWQMLVKAHESLVEKMTNPDAKVESDLPPQLQTGGVAPPKPMHRMVSKDDKLASAAKKEKAIEAAADAAEQEQEFNEIAQRQMSSPSKKTDESSSTDATMDSAAGGDSGAAAPSTQVDAAEQAEVKKTMGDDVLSQDELDLLKQIQESKDTTVHLNMSELVGLSKEEKIALFKEKQNQYRKEKSAAQVRNKLNKERQRRENIKAAQEAQRKREEYQRKMLAQRKRREKEEEARRKAAIRAKIAADKERRQKQRERAAAAKASQQNQPKPPQ